MPEEVVTFNEIAGADAAKQSVLELLDSCVNEAAYSQFGARPPRGLLLVGPPGTGKTHVIAGIISMLMGRGTKRIHVCAPSNAAVDEIMVRLTQEMY